MGTNSTMSPDGPGKQAVPPCLFGKRRRRRTRASRKGRKAEGSGCLLHGAEGFTVSPRGAGKVCNQVPGL